MREERGEGGHGRGVGAVSCVEDSTRRYHRVRTTGREQDERRKVTVESQVASRRIDYISQFAVVID